MAQREPYIQMPTGTAEQRAELKQRYIPLTCHERHQQQYSDRKHAVDAVLAMMGKRIDDLCQRVAELEAERTECKGS